MFYIVLNAIVLNNIVRAICRLDSPPVINYNPRRSATSFISVPLEVMNPMNQARHSSYSFLDTSDGSRENKISFRPNGQHIDRNPVGRRPKKLQRNYYPSPDYPSAPHQFYRNDANLRHALKGRRQRIPDRTGVGNYGREKHFDEVDGRKFVHAYDNHDGKKNRHSFKKQESYDEAKRNNRDREENEAAVRERQGRRRDHSDKENHFDKNYDGRRGEKGISLKKKKGHEKSYKKTGFRKVHNRSEYKLDEEFFEHSHHGKNYRQHLDEREKYSKERADAAKKSNHNSGFKEGHSEKEALQNKISDHEEKTGHKKEFSEQKHEDEHSKQSKDSGVQEGVKHDQTKESTGSNGSSFNLDDIF